MKIASYDRYGGPEVVALRDVPLREPDAHQLRVAVTACALNPKDVLVRSGKFKRITGKVFPRAIGYDYAGRVDAVGSKISRFKPGDAVFGMINLWAGGACAESVLAVEDELALAPGSISLAEAAAVPLASLTALQALRDLAKIRAGSRVCINGASGGVGTFAVQIAKALGAHVTALCSASNHELVKALGADIAIDYHATPPQQLPGPYDCFFDVLGDQSLGRVRKRLAPRGFYITTVPNQRNIRDHVLTRLWPGKRARSVVVRSRQADLEQVARWVDEGQLRPVIDPTLPIAQIVDAQLRLQSKRTRGKIVLTL
jgi:NADPH:quinone reductase-like Zn-dependent oxidoreductase